jgi:hypothetical protein
MDTDPILKLQHLCAVFLFFLKVAVEARSECILSSYASVLVS